MEDMIGKMLQSFEEGKLTRRQLIQSLAVVTTAAQAVKAAPVPEAAPALPPAMFFSKKELAANFEHHKFGDNLYLSDFGTRDFILKTNSLAKPSITPEVHLQYSEVFYVVKGSARMITGGKLVGRYTEATWPAHLKEMGLPPDRPMSKETIGGKNIEGGQTRQVSEGDVIVIPNGVAFWINEIIDSPFWFFNVRCR
jgi:mannose-6-phosphate isomerase-like protein (cupin superfamily)